MIAGHLEIKKGNYYAVLSYTDPSGKRKRPWIPLHLPEKGNKRRAEAMLAEIRAGYEIPLKDGYYPDMPFTDYLLCWLDIAKARVRPTTYAAYQSALNSVIIPYFEPLHLSLQELHARHIQAFYMEKLKTVKPSTVIRYHAIIHQALKYAFKTDMVAQNVASKVDRPKLNDFKATFLTAEELQTVFDATANTPLELPVLVAAFYGLRRGEVVGLKWSAIDFEKNTLTICHTVTSIYIDGKRNVIEQDATKTKAGLRTLPLIGRFKEYFLQAKEWQAQNRRICKNSYDKQYLDYVFVDEMGKRLLPNTLTTQFPKILEKNGVPKMRFHDLRHSCASLLLANGVPLKQIQEWLGHSDFSTTANIYAHLDFSSKISSAEALEGGIVLPTGSLEKCGW